MRFYFTPPQWVVLCKICRANKKTAYKEKSTVFWSCYLQQSSFLKFNWPSGISPLKQPVTHMRLQQNKTQIQWSNHFLMDKIKPHPMFSHSRSRFIRIYVTIGNKRQAQLPFHADSKHNSIIRPHCFYHCSCLCLWWLFLQFKCNQKIQIIRLMA